MKKIAIIGAGMAGLSALASLHSAGHSVTVFEKSRGSGGRLATKKIGNASWDMGAQYIRAHTESFAATLQQWEDKQWVAEWPVTPWVIDESSCSPSSDDVKRYVGLPRMTGLSRKLLEGANEFHAQTRIVTTHFDGQWYLSSDDNRQFGPFDALIINTPPEQARPLIPFTSPASASIAFREIRPCWTLLMSFSERLQTDIDAAFVHTGELSWIARNSSKPGRSVSSSNDNWVIQANHDWSSANIDTSRIEIQRRLSHAFFHTLGLSSQPATETWLHRWLYAIPTESPKLGALYDETHNLAICGDWCHTPSVEGAWLSGQEAARYINKEFS